VAALLIAFSSITNAGIDEARAAHRRGDYAAALQELRPLADQGDAAAQTLLGYMYEVGQGVAQNDFEALTWYRKAADQGHPPAQHNMGVMYSAGRGVDRDDVAAVLWYRKAADQGLDLAQ
jgi:TPR repeat protein